MRSESRVPSGATVGVHSAAAAGFGAAVTPTNSIPVRNRSPISVAASFIEQARMAARREIGSEPPASEEKSFQTPVRVLIDSERPGSPDRLPILNSWPSRCPCGNHS